MRSVEQSLRQMRCGVAAAAVLGPIFAVGAAAQTVTPVVTPGFTLSTFTLPPTGHSAPDSIAVYKDQSVWIGYGDGNAPDGSDGKSNVIVQYDLSGNPLQTVTVVGHNDGLRVDPANGKIWAMQNEDANPNLVVITPGTGTSTTELYNFVGAQPHGGGYDDMAFTSAGVYVSASNPTLNSSTGESIGPSLVKITLDRATHTVKVKPELKGTPKAFDIVTGKIETLNLTDPDSLQLTPDGDLLLDSQGDGLLVQLNLSGKDEPRLQVLHLIGSVQIDDTEYPASRHGFLLVADTAANVVYRIDAPSWDKKAAFSASTGVAATNTTPAVPGYVGQLQRTGALLPIVTDLGAPHGLGFVNTSAAP